MLPLSCYLKPMTRKEKKTRVFFSMLKKKSREKWAGIKTGKPHGEESIYRLIERVKKKKKKHCPRVDRPPNLSRRFSEDGQVHHTVGEVDQYLPV